MLHPDYPLWSSIGVVLVLLPIPWHWRARNVATLAICFWISLGNLIVFVNTLIWADNYRDSAPVWCDISGRILLIIPYAIPACSLSQMRRLESVASTRRSVISATERTRRLWTEAMLCLVFPILMLPLLYIVQGHRYDVVENIGPVIPIFLSWPALVLRYLVPMALSLASLIYASLAVRWFLVRRLQFRAILASSNTGLTSSRYLRLIALAVTDVVVLVASDVTSLSTALSLSPLASYESWSFVHWQYHYVIQAPESIKLSVSNSAAVVGLYSGPVYAILFFIFFGLGEEAISEYLRVWHRILGMLGRLGFKIQSRTNDDGMIPTQRLPTLGTKAIPASDRAWYENSSAIKDKDDGLFDPASPHDHSAFARGGIPILVERSVV